MLQLGAGIVVNYPSLLAGPRPLCALSWAFLGALALSMYIEYRRDDSGRIQRGHRYIVPFARLRFTGLNSIQCPVSEIAKLTTIIAS
jgi:uncharacterized membrane protein